MKSVATAFPASCDHPDKTSKSPEIPPEVPLRPVPGEPMPPPQPTEPSPGPPRPPEPVPPNTPEPVRPPDPQGELWLGGPSSQATACPRSGSAFVSHSLSVRRPREDGSWRREQTDRRMAAYHGVMIRSVEATSWQGFSQDRV